MHTISWCTVDAEYPRFFLSSSQWLIQGQGIARTATILIRCNDSYLMLLAQQMIQLPDAGGSIAIIITQ